jgi:hypothetical protein
MRRCVGAVLMVACSREAGEVAAPAEAPAPASPVMPRPAVRSCAATAPPQDVAVDPRIEVGVAGGANWLFGYAESDAALLRLGAAGELARTPVPLRNTQAAATLGDRIYLYAPREAEPAAPPRWTVVDATDPDAPRVGEALPLELPATHTYPSAFAVGARRAVLVVGYEPRALVSVDPRTRRAVGAPHVLAPGTLPVQASCGDDRCAVLAIRDEGGGPARRLVALRADPEGRVTEELLAPGWIGAPHVAVHGERVLVAWSEHAGVRLRALDRTGRALGPAHAPPAGGQEALLAGLARPRLALGGRDGWSAAEVADDGSTGPLRALAGASHAFLTGATLADGLAWASISGEVGYDELGSSGIMMHSWSTRIVGGFAANDGATSSTSLVTTGGSGRGGFGVWVLVRDGRAAVLTVPQGEAYGEPSRLFSLRAPCAAE